jgi:glycosyltransferase involved in cell wall biosynthesis
MPPDYSIVVPVFNEEKVLPEFYNRLTTVIKTLSGTFEILFVNDGSGDSTESMLRDFHRQDQRVKVINFSRNFGHQEAITAGIDLAQGNACIIMDADLQDPPEVIPGLIERWQAGYEVVFAVRSRREGEDFFKLLTANLFYVLLKKLARIEIPQNAGDFRLLDRKVIEALKKLPERNRFVRGLVSWVGFKQTKLLYQRDARFAGQTKYPFFKMLKFALDGITAFSDIPLRLATWLGLLFSFASFLIMLWVIWAKLLSDRTVLGWASIMVAILLIGGVQLFTVGILGEYVARTFDEAKQRPLYLIRETWGIEK